MPLSELPGLPDVPGELPELPEQTESESAELILLFMAAQEGEELNLESLLLQAGLNALALDHPDAIPLGSEVALIVLDTRLAQWEDLAQELLERQKNALILLATESWDMDLLTRGSHSLTGADPQLLLSQGPYADVISRPFRRLEILSRVRTQLQQRRMQLKLHRQHRALQWAIRAREQSEALLQGVLQVSLDGIGVLLRNSAPDLAAVDTDFSWQMANPVLQRIWGQKELADRSLRATTPASIRQHLVTVCHDVQVQQQPYHGEFYFSFGEIQGWFQLTVVPLDEGVTLTLRDITVLKDMTLELEKQVRQDGLTGLANRYCFDEYLELAWRRCQRDGAPLSVIMCDVDYFKRYNDTYGHVDGDACLVQVARVLRQSLQRPGDLPARYGGEEFAAILSHTSIEGAKHVAEAMRKAVTELEMPHLASPHQYVSLSLGVASLLPGHGQNPEQLLEMADQALYAAKGAGRNCVSQYSEVNKSLEQA